MEFKVKHMAVFSGKRRPFFARRSFMRLLRLPKRDPARFRDESPLARLIRLGIVILLMGGVAFGLWLNNERRLARMIRKEEALMIDRTGLLAPAQERELAEYCRKFQAAYGIRLLLSIRNTPFPLPFLLPEERAGTLFLGLCPPARQVALEIPPLLQAPLGPVRAQLESLLRQSLEQGRWPEGLQEALNLLSRTLDAALKGDTAAIQNPDK